MKIPASWLQDYLPGKLTARQMADSLEMVGIEVDAISSGQEFGDNVIVAKVTKVSPHPNADRLRLVTLDAGKQLVDVVCGAANVAEGQKVALARPGALLPGNIKIEAAEIRGIKSEGMICSEQELGIGDNHAGIMILPESYPTGKPLSRLWPAEDILDLSTPANRADVLSVIGLAREIAAHRRLQLKLPKLPEVAMSAKGEVPAMITTPLVDRYVAAKLTIKAPGVSPLWLQQRLQGAGIRPINLIVDITNYVMVEYGQPLHAFDAGKIKLPITVRVAKMGEKLTTLDGVKRDLTTQDVVIADTSHLVALAGIMGGESSQINDQTKHIILEAATFRAAKIRKSAVRLGLRTDASARFERSLPPELASIAAARTISLLQQLAGAELVGEVTDCLQIPLTTLAIDITVERVAALMGVKNSAASITSHLQALGFGVEAAAASSDGLQHLIVTVPWWRPDVKIAEDIVEEVVRLVGYDKVPATLPGWQPTDVNFDHFLPMVWRVKAALKAQNLFEVNTYSFVSEDQLAAVGISANTHLKLKNPMSQDQAYLRSSLLPSLLTAVVQNQHQRKQFGFYEISNVFTPKSKQAQPDETLKLGVMVKVEGQAYQLVKAALDAVATGLGVKPSIKVKSLDGLHPNRSAEIWLNGHMIGKIGEIHPAIVAKSKIGAKLGALELDIRALVGAAQTKIYQPINRYPDIFRDIAVVLPDKVTWSQVEAIVVSSGVIEVSFLSDFYGRDLPEDHKSLAMRIKISDREKTLTDAEARERVNRVVKLLKAEFGAELR